MLFWEKIKETVGSVVPIMLLVLLLHATIAPLPGGAGAFVLGGALLCVGLSLFLMGVEIGILPMGQRVGSALTLRRSLLLIVGVGFLIGVVVTMAEPDVRVLADQVTRVAPGLSGQRLVVMIALGVGFFVSVALARIILQISYTTLLVFFYAVLFLCAVISGPSFLGIAFDAGGVTTGPMTAPFIMAVGVGVAAVRGGKSNDDSFGLVGLASIGPVLAVLLLGMFFQAEPPAEPVAAGAAAANHTLAARFLHLVPEVFYEVSMALGPLALMFMAFRFTLCKMARHQAGRVLRGLIYTFLGLMIFFIGAKGGLLDTGRDLGALLAGYQYPWILIPIGLTLGAMAVCAEPAVWVLTGQVEDVSGGHIKQRIMLVALAAGVACAVGAAMLRVLTGLSLWWFLAPGYALALALTRFCPKMFTAIAFDSGGVAAGPMASTLILSFTLGASGALGGNPVTDAFGVIALIAMAPRITIQIVGILFHRKEAAIQRLAANVCVVPVASSTPDDHAE